jgi:ADP-ribosylation factor-binding protein GGA
MILQNFTLSLEPQTGRTLAPKQVSGITQTIRVVGVERGKGGQVKMRWKASYLLGTEKKEEQGEVSNFGVS